MTRLLLSLLIFKAGFALALARDRRDRIEAEVRHGRDFDLLMLLSRRNHAEQEIGRLLKVHDGLCSARHALRAHVLELIDFELTPVMPASAKVIELWPTSAR